jgi:cytochrome c6
VVNAAKTLKKEDLAKYGKDSVEAIVTQVTKGMGAMPAFGGRLSAEEY